MAQPSLPCKRVSTLLPLKQEKKRNFEVEWMENVMVKGRGDRVHTLNLSKLETRSSAKNKCGRRE